MVLQKLKYFHLNCVVVESCTTKLTIRHIYRQGNAVKTGITVTNYSTKAYIVQTSNFSCAESNVNELNPLFELICIRLDT